MENNNNNEIEKTVKNDKNKSSGLTYSLSDQLDKLFPQYKPSKKKKEEND